MRGNLQRVAAEIIKNKKSIPEKEVMRAVLLLPLQACKGDVDGESLIAMAR